MRNCPLLIIALVLTGFIPRATTAAEFGAPRIVVAAPEDARFAHLSWPKVVTAPDGTLVLAYIAGREHVNGDGCPAVSISSDGGKTFSKPQILREFDKSKKYQHGANLAMGVAEDGAIILMVMSFTNDERNSIFGWRSEDSGKNWTSVDTSSLAESKTGSVFGHVFAVPGKGLAVSGHFRKPAGSGIWMAFSPDHGKTWGDPETITDEAYFEPTFLFAGEKLIGLIRENKAHAYHQYISDDLGESWQVNKMALQGDSSATHPSPFLIEDPEHPGQLYALQTQRGKNNQIHLWKANASADADGLQWEHLDKIIEVPTDQDFGYPWMTYLGDGKWFLVYYAGRKVGSNSIRGMTLSLP